MGGPALRAAASIPTGVPRPGVYCGRPSAPERHSSDASLIASGEAAAAERSDAAHARPHAGLTWAAAASQAAREKCQKQAAQRAANFWGRGGYRALAAAPRTFSPRRRNRPAQFISRKPLPPHWVPRCGGIGTQCGQSGRRATALARHPPQQGRRGSKGGRAPSASRAGPPPRLRALPAPPGAGLRLRASAAPGRHVAPPLRAAARWRRIADKPRAASRSTASPPCQGFAAARPAARPLTQRFRRARSLRRCSGPKSPP